MIESKPAILRKFEMRKLKAHEEGWMGLGGGGGRMENYMYNQSQLQSLN